MSLAFEHDYYLHAVEVDISTMATRPIQDLNDDSLRYPLYLLTRNDYIMYVRSEDGITLLKDGKLQFEIGFRARLRLENCYYSICSRWNQQFGVDIYMIDEKDDLYTICWTDIEKGTPVAPKLIDSQVEDFYVIRKGMAIVYRNGDLKLPGSIKVDSKTIPADVKWSTILYTSNRWIVAGHNKGHVVLVRLSTKCIVRSSLTIKLSHNGYDAALLGTLKYLKVAVERRYCCLLLAFGTDGCCHLISMRRSRPLILVRSIASILDTNVDYDYDSNKFTLSVADTSIEGQFIMTGYKQINMITLKYK